MAEEAVDLDTVLSNFDADGGGKESAPEAGPGDVASVSARKVFYDIDTAGGQAEAP